MAASASASATIYKNRQIGKQIVQHHSLSLALSLSLIPFPLSSALNAILSEVLEVSLANEFPSVCSPSPLSALVAQLL